MIENLRPRPEVFVLRAGEWREALAPGMLPESPNRVWKFADSVNFSVFSGMALIESATGTPRAITITKAASADFKKLTVKRYHFSWKPFEKDPGVEVYKLELTGQKDILGVVALEYFPGDQRIEIRLLACSAENVGMAKVYQGIAGHLIAHACVLALERYGEDACVSLFPKTELKAHYMATYHMRNAGRQVFLEGMELVALILRYTP